MPPCLVSTADPFLTTCALACCCFCCCRAIELGQWVLLDSANLCNPTVLDRLNPLLEPHGVPRWWHRRRQRNRRVCLCWGA